MQARCAAVSVIRVGPPVVLADVLELLEPPPPPPQAPSAAVARTASVVAAVFIVSPSGVGSWAKGI
jgi:hypothetical protein